MPSSSLIAEQKAGTLRHIMYEGISQGMIDIASNFATNVNYTYRERRRQDERKRIAAESHQKIVAIVNQQRGSELVMTEPRANRCR